MATIILDKERALRFTLSSVRRFREVYGRTLAEVRVRRDGAAVAEIVDPSCMTVVLWAGLIHQDDKLTTDKLERILERWVGAGGKWQDLWEPVGKAMEDSGLFSRSKDKEDEEEAGGKDQAPPPTT